ncbi:MAG: histidine--tRNA ligase [Candidatus Lindowbacteria bacterium]|nr:histidine--tRNA ligase [Candidatus Lindowbacteria bacterium]
MAEKIKAPRGTRDIFGSEMNFFQSITRSARSLFSHYGYNEIATPIFEAAELFEKSVGEETDIVSKEMYVFEDRKGRRMTLRPEGTASIVRAFIENNMGVNLPCRLSYVGPMFRYERPQAGRYRQFYQFGVELLGSDSSSADIEVIDLAVRIMERLSLKTRLKLNHLGCSNCKTDFSNKLKTYFEEHKDSLCDDCLQRLERSPLRILDCKVKTCKEIAHLSPSIELCDTCDSNFTEVCDGLTSLDISFQTDTSLVRGLGYYTGTVFEIVSDGLGAQDAVLGGGRYNNLVESMGGKSTPAVGFAAGLDRLISLRNQNHEDGNPTSPHIYVIGSGDQARIPAIQLTQKLRRIFETHARTKGMRAAWIGHEIQGRSLKAALKTADKLKSKYVAIIGEDEVATESVIFREMAEGKQKTIKVEGLNDSDLETAIIETLDELAESRSSTLQ